MHMCRVHAWVSSQCFVEDRRFGCDRLQHIHDGWQWLVGDTDTPYCLLGRLQISRRHGRQHGTTVQDLVACKQSLVLEVTAKAVFWRIPGGEDCLDARQTLGLARIHGEHAGMRMLTETQLAMEQ